ncbi:MAG TPA: hypothetical protein VK869_03970 [Rubrobacteraceae bacterium]|nr:hypothetical protein [Rubrobacteraceae bacterium]
MGVVGVLSDGEPRAFEFTLAGQHVVRVLPANFGSTALDHEPESVANSLAQEASLELLA